MAEQLRGLVADHLGQGAKIPFLDQLTQPRAKTVVQLACLDVPNARAVGGFSNPSDDVAASRADQLRRNGLNLPFLEVEPIGRLRRTNRQFARHTPNLPFLHHTGIGKQGKGADRDIGLALVADARKNHAAETAAAANGGDAKLNRQITHEGNSRPVAHR